MPEPTKRFQCRHIFTDGRRCGSPCLRKPEGHEDFCYYHHTSRRPAHIIGRSRRRTTTFTLPLLEDRSAVQHSISQVLQKLAQNELDPRRAGLLLYGLQIASINLPPQKRLEPAKDEATVDEITTDPSHGTLAVDSELVPPPQEKNSAREVLEDWYRREALREELKAANTLPSIQAVAESQHPKSTANPKPCKTLRTKVPHPVIRAIQLAPRLRKLRTCCDAHGTQDVVPESHHCAVKAISCRGHR